MRRLPPIFTRTDPLFPYSTLFRSVAVAALFRILTRTRLGIRIRAGTLDLETVAVLGVNVRILRNLNFGLGIYLAGLAGVLAAGLLGLQPTIGDALIMPSFVAIIVGGPIGRAPCRARVCQYV